MNKSFQVFAYIFLIVIGGYMFGFTADGHIIKICIACNSFIVNLFAVVSILTGAAGLIGTFSSKKIIAGR